MAHRRFGQGDRTGHHNRRGRRLLNVKVALPRYVIAKPSLENPKYFFFNVPTKFRKLGCPVRNEALGTSYLIACGEDGKGGRAAVLNGLIDEWDRQRKG